MWTDSVSRRSSGNLPLLSTRGVAPSSRSRPRRNRRRCFWLGSAGYLAVIGVASGSPLAARALTGLVAIYSVVDQTPTPTRAAAAVSG